MINASNTFKEKLKDGANIVNYADIVLADGTELNLTYKDFMVGGCSIEDKTTDGRFGVGFCIGKTLTMRIANHDERFSQYDFYGATINLYVAMQLDDGSIEKIRKGVYYAMVPQTPGDIIEISATDGMYRLDRDYSSSTTAYPTTIETILKEACLDCGIPIGFQRFDNMDYIVQSKPEKATYRQIVSYAAQIAGYNARIDNDGYMQLVWYDTSLLDFWHYNGGGFRMYPHDTILDGGNFQDYSKRTIISGSSFTDKVPEHIFRIKSLSVHTDDTQITGVRVVTGDNASELFGEEGYVIEVKDNPFSAGNERQIADYLGQRIVGLIFRPFSAQVLNNPLYEPFEIVRLSDKKGNVYDSLINSVTYTVGNYTQISCESENPLRNGSIYFSGSAVEIAESRKKAEKQLSNYDKAVQNMTQLAGNALGYHTTYEEQADGSRIVYLHDKPALSQSKTIYKQTLDGFFISTDGGESYTAGFDKNGNAIVNILFAIGIVCDWIKGGTLTLGGLNNENGLMKILDAAGNTVCEMSAEQVSVLANRMCIDSDNFKLLGSGEIMATGQITTAINNGVHTRLRGNCLSIYNAKDDEIGRYTATYNASLPDDYTHYGMSLSTLMGYAGIGVHDGQRVRDYYYMNNGHNPSGFTERHLFNEYARFVNTIRLPKIDFTNGSEIRTSIYSSNYDGAAATICSDGFYAYGSIGCSGTKYRVVDTQNYGNVGMSALETAGAYFSDIGSGHIEEDKCYVYFDPVFLETIDQNEEYQVFTTPTSKEQISWVEKCKGYFIVHGDPGASFDWMVVAKQKGYQDKRMSSVTVEGNSEIPYDESIFYSDGAVPSLAYMQNIEDEERLEDEAIQYIKDYNGGIIS